MNMMPKITFATDVKSGPTKGFLQPTRTRKKAELTIEIRKYKIITSTLKVRSIGRILHTLATTDHVFSSKISTLHDFALDIVKRIPEVNFETIDKDILRKIYNKWTQSRSCGLPSTHMYADTIIDSKSEFEELFNEAKIDKIFQLIIDSSDINKILTKTRKHENMKT